MSACCCMHACVCVCVLSACFVCLASGRGGGLLQKCIWGYVSPILSWCAGFQGAMIIHCVKTNLRKIRCTDCIQGNRIEAALTVFHSPRHDNMIFGLLHYRKCHKGPVGKAAGTQYGDRVSSRYLCSSYLTFYPFSQIYYLQILSCLEQFWSLQD